MTRPGKQIEDDALSIPDLAAMLKAVRVARKAREKAERAELDAVTAARAAGASWTRIGEVYGLTKQGAQQRFKPAAPRVVDEAADQG